MKSPARKKFTPSSTPPVPRVLTDSTLLEPLDGGIDADLLFLWHVAKLAKLTAKDFQAVLKVNKTTAYSWFNGNKPHPFRRARQAVGMFREKEGAGWIIPSILEYIAGSNFDGAVLNAEATEHLRELAKAVKGKP